MKIRDIELGSPFAVAPMAGMTDTAFRRLVKRHGGCGLVVTEMVSAEGLVRGIDRTLEYAEYTEEERPISIQIFGGDPQKMADAAQAVEQLGADIVDVKMGFPVTVKMRAGWDDHQKNAPELAQRVADAGASAIAVHGRTASQSYSGFSDWDFISGVAESVSIPVFGSGDVIEADQAIERLRSTAVSGVLIGRGVLRNPWILGQANDLLAGRTPRVVTMQERGQFLLDYIDLLLREGEGEAEGFRHVASKHDESNPSRHDRAARGRDRWVINKLRALGAWYTR